MAVKRLAETELVGPERPPQPTTGLFGSTLAGSSDSKKNPFAGVSLFSSSAGSDSLFTSAASRSNASSGGFATFASSANASASAAPLASSGREAPAGDAAAKPGNPFSGLSLFSADSSSSTASFGLFGCSPVTFAADSFGEAKSNFANVTPVEPKVSIQVLTPNDAPQKDAAPATTKPPGDNAKDEVEKEEEEVPADAECNTGEEDEKVIIRADVKLFKLVRDEQAPVVAESPGDSAKSEEKAIASDVVPPASSAGASGASGDGASASGETASWRWVERGCGKLSVNRHSTTGAGRLVLRMKGNLKILLNTPIFPTTKYEKVGQKSVKFLGVDAEDPSNKALCAYRVNLGSNDQQSRFLEVVEKLLA